MKFGDHVRVTRGFHKPEKGVVWAAQFVKKMMKAEGHS
jgi:hypothetical protein